MDIGQVFLAQVQEITLKDVVVSLPNSLFSYIPLEHVSEPVSQAIENMGNASAGAKAEAIPTLSELFAIGQWIRVAVIEHISENKYTGKTRQGVLLTTRPEKTNKNLYKPNLLEGTVVQACVIEFDGKEYKMDLGIPGVNAFLSSDKPLLLGQVILCAVKTDIKDKTVKLTMNMDLEPVKRGKANTSTLVPGTLVKINVAYKSKNMIAAKIFGIIDATADIFHCGSLKPEEDFTIGEERLARILYTPTGVESPRVSVSLLPHVVKLTEKKVNGMRVSELLKNGMIFDTKVISQNENLGVFCDINIDDVVGFVRLSQLSDDKQDKVYRDGRFKVGSRHRARLISYHSMEGNFTLSFKHSVLNMTITSVDGAHVGQILEGKIERVTHRGIFVMISGTVLGFVPSEHVSDVRVSSLDRFPVGMKVRTRVLKVIPEKRQLMLTMKKMLLGLENIITDYSPSNVEKKSMATILTLSGDHAIVEFFGGVRALLPRVEMSEAPISNVAEMFRVGQVLPVLITSVIPEERKMYVTCRDPKYRVEELKNECVEIKLKPGSILSGTVKSKTDNEVFIELDDKNGVVTVRCMQLDDSKEGCLEKFLKLKKGSRLEEIVILNEGKIFARFEASVKPSLIEATKKGQLPSAFSEIYMDQVVCGYVSNIQKFGLFVEFAGGLSALVPIRMAASTHIEDLNTSFEKDQSVRGRVVQIDQAAGKFIVSLLVTQSRPPRIVPSSVVEGNDKVTNEKESAHELTSKRKHKSDESSNEKLQDNNKEGKKAKIEVKADDLKTQKKAEKKSKSKETILQPVSESDSDSDLQLESAKESISSAESSVESDSGSENSDSSEESESESGSDSEEDADADSDSSSESGEAISVGKLPWNMDPSALINSEKQDDEAKPKAKNDDFDQTATIAEEEPTSAEDFERLLLGSPNSSDIWIRYMAHFLEHEELESARTIAQRALDTIGFRNEDAKLDIWLAWINLEHSSGTKLTLDKVFKKASQYGNPETLQRHLCKLNVQSGDEEAIKNSFDLLLRKYGDSGKNWVIAGEYYYDNNDAERARTILSEGLKAVERRKHVKLINRFARLEYTKGEPERGRTLMEGLLKTMPKRLDLWNTLIDLERKQGNTEGVRTLFDRMLANKISLVKAKTIF